MSSSVLVLFNIILYSITNVVYCDVYCVTPDDDDDDIEYDDGCCFNNSSCDHCYSLQHYLLNVSKYFISDTRLHFWPGLHHLSTNLVIQNVNNFSLIGSRHTTISCTGVHHIILVNCSNVTIKDFVIAECGLNARPDVMVVVSPGVSQSAAYTVGLHYCSSVTMKNIEIMSRNDYNAVLNLNTMGNSSFHSIRSAGMTFVYYDNGTMETFTTGHVLVDNYQCNLNINQSGIIINFHQTLFTIHLEIVNINLCNVFIFINAQSCNNHAIKINDCSCSGKIAHEKSALFEISSSFVCPYEASTIQFKNCHFIGVMRHSTLTLINVDSSSSLVSIIDCSFVNTNNIIPIIIESYMFTYIDIHQEIKYITVLIKKH